MFDMQHVGKIISNLRKENNMTQMELADKLNISFQAVSNWERGQSMPDISKLGELAAIFGVTIDGLLGNEKSAQVVEKLIREDPIDEKLTAEEFLDVAPIVKPKQAEKLWENIKAGVSMKDLISAAPFLSESMLDSLVLETVKKEKSIASILGLMPFLSQEAVDDCAKLVLEDGTDITKVIMMVPFMSRESIERLADRIMETGSVMELEPLAPFLENAKLSGIAARLAEKYGFSKVIPLLPFLDRSLLDDFFRNTKKE
jgi:transcriptional regulator with XRE-family HTH domain